MKLKLNSDINFNSPYHVSQRTPLRGDNVSDSQNQQKEKTKSKQSKKSHSQLDTGKSYLGELNSIG